MENVTKKTKYYSDDCKGCLVLDKCTYRKNRYILFHPCCPCRNCLVKMKCSIACDRFEVIANDFLENTQGYFEAYKEDKYEL